MSEFLQRLFSGGGFMPHGHCYFWQPEIIWLHVASDSLIALAYYSIPLTLVYFIRKRRDLPYPWMFLMFGGFIVACGTTHVMEIWSIWHSTYWLSGSIKAITALLSIVTAIQLVKLVPEALLLRGPLELTKLNAELEREVGERRRAEEEVRRLNAGLETRVRERTDELARTNTALQTEIAERKRAEERVRQLNTDLERRVNELQAVLDVLPVGVGIARDAQCRDIRMNNAFARSLGLATGMNASKSAPGGEAPANFRVLANGRELRAEELPMQRAAAQGIEIRDQEEEIVFPDGRTLHLLAYATPLRDEEDRVCGSVGAFVDITEHKQATEARRESEARARAMLESALDCIVSVDHQGRIIEFNLAAERTFGRTRAEAMGRLMAELIIPPPLRERHRQAFARHLATGEATILGKRIEMTALRADGAEFPIELAVTRIPGKEPPTFTAFMRDITGRKEAEERIQASLREKDVMLKEIHHRVKNNLQIVSSLLRLQSRHLKHPETVAAFEESGSRVQSMALVHEKLYQSSSLSELDFAAYAQSLTDSLLRSYGTDPSVIRLHLDMDKVHLNINQAIPCALILNELVANALKYAFPNGRQGEIRLRLHCDPDGTTHMSVGDNGVGLPADFNPDKTGSLGLQLVNTLVHQLRGHMEASHAEGTQYTLTFTAEAATLEGV